MVLPLLPLFSDIGNILWRKNPFCFYFCFVPCHLYYDNCNHSWCMVSQHPLVRSVGLLHHLLKGNPVLPTGTGRSSCRGIHDERCWYTLYPLPRTKKRSSTKITGSSEGQLPQDPVTPTGLPNSLVSGNKSPGLEPSWPVHPLKDL